MKDDQSSLLIHAVKYTGVSNCSNHCVELEVLGFSPQHKVNFSPQSLEERPVFFLLYET